MKFLRVISFSVFLLCPNMGVVASPADSGILSVAAQVESVSSNAGSEALWNARIDSGRVYFEIDAHSIGKDFVVWMRGASHFDVPVYQLARWERRKDVLVLWVSKAGRENEGLSWRDNSVIARTFATEQGAERGAVQVDVTPLFSGKRDSAWRLSYPDRLDDRFKFESVKSFPSNVVVSMAPQHGEEGPKPAPLQWNFIKLPDLPMKARKFDRRSGYRYPGLWFSTPENASEENEVMVRWRLERREVGRASEAVRPIDIYIDPMTPERWRPWVRRGIESWRVAFESIGILQAVVAVDPGIGESFDYDDIRRSTLCWGTFPYPCGWTVFDPRTGELLQYQMHSVDNALKYQLAKYVVSMAALDHRVMEVPLSDEIPGALIEKVAAHEVGHILGLRDGTYGTFAYTLDQVRSEDWVRERGISPSIMNYSRFNYVAQPDDGMPVDLLVQKVGPTDGYLMALGYSSSVDEEDDLVLDKLILMQNDNPSLRFATGFIPTMDPTYVLDAVSITDPVAAATLGIENLGRSIALLASHEFRDVDSEVTSLLKPYELYESALQQWLDMVTPPIAMIGGYVPKAGVNADLRKIDLDWDDVVPVAADDQRRALEFLCANVFSSDPVFLTDMGFAGEAQVEKGKLKEWLEQRRSYLFDLLIHPVRLDRLANQRGLMSKAGEIDRTDDIGSVDTFGVIDLLRGLKACVIQ